ncbi:MAG: hypothetical protein ACKOW9_02090 [Candidatus Paceibacterota bacterium]
MDSKIKKAILEYMLDLLKNAEYTVDNPRIQQGVHKIYIEKFKKDNEVNFPYANSVTAQIIFLLDSGCIIKENNSYRLTEWGEICANGFSFRRIWYWLIYRNHNLSVVISIISLIVSIIALAN